jgi:hypothetical protein
MVACAIALAVLGTTNHSLTFAGGPQVAVVPYQKPLDVTGPLTIEAWIYLEPGSKQQFFNYFVSRNYADLGYGILVQGGAEKRIHSGIGDDVKPMPFNQWVHVAYVHSPPEAKLYVDGELAAAIANAVPLKPVGLPLRIGNSDFFNGSQRTGFIGRIDEVRLWTVARTQRQIRDHMRRYLRGTERSLLAYFTFDEGKGQIIHDFTGRLMSGMLGDSYREDAADPAWSEGVPLKGRSPKPR